MEGWSTVVGQSMGAGSADGL